MPAERYFERGFGLHLPGFEPFAFAGIWESSRDGDEVVESCRLLTTEPNDLVRAIGHSRMPVMLTNAEQCTLWLNPDITEHKNWSRCSCRRIRRRWRSIGPRSVPRLPASSRCLNDAVPHHCIATKSFPHRKNCEPQNRGRLPLPAAPLARIL